jgi:hypothetical protein
MNQQTITYEKALAMVSFHNRELRAFKLSVEHHSSSADASSSLPSFLRAASLDH